MNEPTPLEYIITVFCCLCLAVIGLFFLANFGRMFKGRIKNEWLRQNVVVWLIIFFLVNSQAPLSGGFKYAVIKLGWPGFIGVQALGCLLYTLITYNICRWLANHKGLKKLTFAAHKLLILAALVISSLIIQTGLIYMVYRGDPNLNTYLKYSTISNIYLSAAIGLVYAAVNYL